MLSTVSMVFSSNNVLIFVHEKKQRWSLLVWLHYNRSTGKHLACVRNDEKLFTKPRTKN